MNICEEFEKQVILGLEKCNFPIEKILESNKPIGIAVSGGADSVSLLVSLCRILKNVPIKVITVNHFIRPIEESCGDVNFVINLCNSLKDQGFDVEVIVHELTVGLVKEKSTKEKIGIEASARELRYDCFEKSISDFDLLFLALAHNSNDQLETLLMRFLQGSSVDSSAGILSSRGMYIRPLLFISRKQIESYLFENKINFCLDKTNEDNSYLRNKIRNKLVPLLNEEFCGWEHALINGAEKAYNDSVFIKKYVDELFSRISKVQKECISLNAKIFLSEEKSIQIRLLMKSLNCLGVKSRIPYKFLNSIINNGSAHFTYEKINFNIFVKKDEVFIKKERNLHTDLTFFDIIKEEGFYYFPFGIINVFYDNGSHSYKLEINGCSVDVALKLPICIRNAHTADVVENSKGEQKKVLDIFSDWHVGFDEKKMIPVIQDIEKQKIICILGKFLRFKDWIVKEK